jgi:hypothetical protein
MTPPCHPLTGSAYTCYPLFMANDRTPEEIEALRAQIIANMHQTIANADAERAKRRDRRSRTSRANLGAHVPDPLSAGGPSTVLTVRIPAELAAALDAEVARSNLLRSDIVRWCLEHALPESRKIPPYQPW